MKTKVLFICNHNSARSQMAQAFLNHSCNGQFEAESAGLESGALNPLAVEAMAEVGIDISGQPSNLVWELFKAGRVYGYVITVCDDESAETCPIFPGTCVRLHWSFPNPARFTGSHAEKHEKVREVRDAIAAQVAAFCAEKAGVYELST
jgi:arsenate reductase (thioredoxin)